MLLMHAKRSRFTGFSGLFHFIWSSIREIDVPVNKKWQQTLIGFESLGIPSPNLAA
jgi:hypothetical protein